MAEARAHGFSDAMVNEALAGVEPREQVISEDRNQAEVVQTLEQYYRIRVSPHDGRARTGPTPAAGLGVRATPTSNTSWPGPRPTTAGCVRRMLRAGDALRPTS